MKKFVCNFYIISKQICWFIINYRGGNQTTCRNGYEGILCDSCVMNELKFYKINGVCLECPESKFLLLLNISYILGAFIFIAYTVKLIFFFTKVLNFLIFNKILFR